MNVEEIRAYCLSKKGATESFPFDDATLVFKLLNKMFALISLDGDLRINLKCEPELAIELRERYDYVFPGYHMNKRHWNTIEVSRCPDDKQIKAWIDSSYELIFRSLSRKKQKELLNLP